MAEQDIKIDEVSIDPAPDATDAAPATDAPAAAPTPDDTQTIADLTAQVAELNDKYLRLAAELENTRRRASLDMESAARTRAMSVADHFLPMVDAITAACAHTPDDPGIQAMARAMDASLAQVGITRIETVGQILNPQFHNAIQVTDAPADCDPKPAPNTIVSELQAGYMFGDSVLRTAMVVVCK
ncbi:nucleotide exchange factor GrpE [bacterium]|nr:nucleotide exchange factor GrpE [bacterium]